MMRIRKNVGVPYGGRWEINQPEKGFVGAGTTFEMLERNVQKYMRSNGIPIGLGFLRELEEAVCALYSKECEHFDPNLPGRPRTLNFSEIVTGTKVMASFLKEGSPVVSQEEANRRAAICKGCQYNTAFSRPCGGLCPELRKLILAIVGNRKVPDQDQLRSCQLCGCYLEAAVWLPLEIQVPPLSQEQKNQFSKVPWCWKRIDL